MKMNEKRLNAISERQKLRRTFSRISVIHELPIKDRIMLLKNLGISLKDNRKITNHSELERVEKLPEKEWIHILFQVKARGMVDQVSELGGKEAVEEFLVLLEEFGVERVGTEEFKQQLQDFNNRFLQGEWNI